MMPCTCLLKQIKIKIIVLVFSVLFCHAGAAYSQKSNKLFSDPLSGTQSPTDKNASDPTIIRERQVQVNFDLLTPSRTPADESNSLDIIEFNLFDGVTLPVIKIKVNKRGSEDYSWFGKVVGMKYSNVIIVKKKDVIVGYIHAEDKQYQIKTSKKGYYVVREIDQSAFPDEAPPLKPPPSDSGTSASYIPQNFADTGNTIDVMVVYTATAAAGVADIDVEIQAAIDATNQAYSDSNVTQRINLVHTAQVTYTDPVDSSIALNALQSTTDGNIDNVHTLRDTYGADIVTLFVDGLSDACGRGWVLADPANSSFDVWAFNVVDIDCATASLAYPHELGHNMGAHHDRDNSSSECSSGSQAYDYACGYREVTNGRFRTIMAYSDNCPGGGSCARIGYFSNPDINDPIYAEPTGIDNDISPATSADNARALDGTALLIANFRQSVDVVVTIPTLTDIGKVLLITAMIIAAVYKFSRSGTYKIQNSDLTEET